MKSDNSIQNSDSNQMALQRTVMAADRSLMAWVRTGLSLISFGFTIYKFLNYSREQLITAGKQLGPVSDPKMIGLFMIGMGILSLIFGTIENVTIIRNLRGQYTFSYARYSLIMAGILTIFGLVIFIGITLEVQ